MIRRLAALTIAVLVGVWLVRTMSAPNEKFWAHRCDSIEKIRLMSEKFSGIEIDATFYPSQPAGRRFDVSHDFKPSVEYPLEEFLPTLAALDNPIWFDFKNLTAENSEAALEELDWLLERHGIDRRRLIVESHNYEELRRFRARGYYTAYCVPIHESAYGEEIVRDEEFLFRSQGMVEYFCRLVREAAESGAVDAVTFPVTYYRLVKYAGVESDLMTWDTHGERWWDFYWRRELLTVLSDEQVRVILVDAPTEFDR